MVSVLNGALAGFSAMLNTGRLCLRRRVWQLAPRRQNKGLAANVAAVLLIGGAASSVCAAPAGSIPGRFSVNPSGAATYEVPIAVPPGTAGLQPELSLSYDSSAGNGILGVGWRIEGLAAIQRCPRTIAQDGASSAIELSLNDRFCLDGERLVAVAGTYGTAGSEYRTEIDGFTKVVASGASGNGPASFTATTREGVKLEFGATTDSRFFPVGKTTPVAWALNKVTDARGNYFTVTYVNDTTNGQYYPSRIDYTGNASSAPVLAPYNSVQFAYETTRSDVESGYIVGSKFRNTARLTNVRTYVGPTLVHNYVLAYGTSGPTGRSRINTITLCDAGGVCLPSTNISWSSDALTFTGSQITAPSYDASTQRSSSWADVNGDGRLDACRVLGVGTPDPELGYLSHELRCMLSTASGFSGEAVTTFGLGAQNLSWYDINGDGLSDPCNGRTCRLSTGSGFTGSLLEPPLAGGGQNLLVDVNGDGRTDFCSVTSAGVANCYLSNGSGFGSAIALGTVPNWSTLKTQQAVTFWANVSGDGVKSYCRLITNTIRCQKFTPSGFATDIVSGTLNFGQATSRFWADVNGDGKDDFCTTVVTTSPAGYLSCVLSTGTGFGDTLTSASLPGYKTQESWVDFNGDGKADYCRTKDGVTTTDASIECLLSTGTGFAGTVTTGNLATNNVGFQRVQDYRGDAKPAYCRLNGPTTAKQWTCTQRSGTLPDQMTSLTNGLGASTSITYAPLTAPSSHSKGTGAAYPNIDLQDATHVAVSVTESNGIGGTIATTYSYGGAQTNLHGRGFLGFKVMSATLPNGLSQRREYSTGFPYAGLPTLSSLTTSSGQVIASEATTYSAATTGPGTQAIYKTSQVDKSWDLNGVFISWLEHTRSNFDAYGNPQAESKVSRNADGSADGNTTSVSLAYDNKTTPWILGLPTGITTTSTVPGGASTTRTASRSYFPNGLLQQEILEPNNAGLPVTNLRLATVFTYDSFGNMKTRWVGGASIEDRTELTLDYDSKGRFPTTESNALSQPQSRTFDERFGTALTLVDLNNLTTTWTFDGFGRLATETAPDGSRRTVTYNDCPGCWGQSFLRYTISRSHFHTVTGATLTPTTVTVHDVLGREYQRSWSHFDGAQTVYLQRQYDSLGRLASVAEPRLATETERATSYLYDAIGRPTSITRPATGVENRAYDGRVFSATNSKSQVTRVERNGIGQISRIYNAYGSPDQSHSTRTYGPFGTLVGLADAAGNTMSAVYDVRGRRTSVSDPNLGSWSYLYDNLSQLVSQVNARGNVANVTYDKLGRVVRREQPGLDGRWDYDIAANGVGKLAEAYTLTGTGVKDYRRVHAYDSLSRPSAILTRTDWDYTTSFSYDASQRLETTNHYRNAVGVGGGPFVSFHSVFNAQGYLARIERSADGGARSSMWEVALMDGAGRVLRQRLGNGLATERRYGSSTGLLDGASTGPDGGSGLPTTASVQNDSYSYDALANLTSRTHLVSTGGASYTESFTYDSLNRLLTSTVAGQATKSFTYNAIGNITSKSNVGAYQYPAPGSARPHAVSSITGTVSGITNPSFSYDPNGNLLNGLGRAYTWTAFDQPLQIDKLSGGSAVQRTEFVYGPEQQRLKQVIRPVSGGVAGAPTTTLHYLGSIEKEIDTATSTTIVRTYAPSGIGFVEERIAGTSVAANASAIRNPKYLHTDRLGSPVVVTDGTGAVQQRMSYDSWGRRRNPDGTDDSWASLGTLKNSQDKMGFSGQEQLDQVGLVHMNGRILDPIVGRMVSGDPTVPDPSYSQALNRYAYVYNAPQAFVDPSGYAPVSVTPYVVGSSGQRGFGGGVGAGVSGFPQQWGIEDWADPICDGSAADCLPPAKKNSIHCRIYCIGAGADSKEDSDKKRATAQLERVEITGTRLEPADQNAAARSWLAGLEVSKVKFGDSIGPGCERSDCLRNLVTLVGLVAKPVALVQGAYDSYQAASINPLALSLVGGKLGTAKATTLKPGPFAKGSIPGHRGKPTAAEQKQVNALMEKNGCHTCGTKDPGTTTGNAIVDHQPPQALGETKEFLPHCIHCMRRQGGETLQELVKRANN